MARRWCRVLLGAAMGVMLAACAAPRAEAPSGMAIPTVPVGTVVAPNGEVLARCTYVGVATTATVDGAPVVWSCGTAEGGDTAVLVGDISLGGEGWEIAQAAVPAEGAAEAEVTDSVLVLGMVLDDGTACFSAGTGATAGYQDQRLNFTCEERSQDGTFTALFGELQAADAGYEVLRATGAITADGFQASESDTPTVAALYVES